MFWIWAQNLLACAASFSSTWLQDPAAALATCLSLRFPNEATLQQRGTSGVLMAAEMRVEVSVSEPLQDNASQEVIASVGITVLDLFFF